MQLANDTPRLLAAGAEVVAVSVDAAGRNEALRDRWHLPFPIAADPDGTRILRPLDAWNPDERDGIAWPTIHLFDPSAQAVFRFRSRDHADRPDDTGLLAAADRLGLPPLDLPPAPRTAEPEQAREAFRVDAFGPFFRGIRSGTRALAPRLTSPTDRSAAAEMTEMASAFLDAWRTRREAAEERGPQR